MVLLRNEPVEGAPVLPLDPARLRRLAVVGRLADLPNTGDHGSSDVRAPQVVTFLAGLRAALPDTRVVHDPGEDLHAAARLAADADAVLVVAGYTAEDEGEYVSSALFTDPELSRLLPPGPRPGAGGDDGGAPDPDASLVGGFTTGGDRALLTLRPEDEALVLAVAAANPRTVVGVVAAGAVLTERWRHRVPAVLVLWYAGMEGGNALADVLLGRCDASGRLPFAVPVSADHLPAFDRDAATVRYGPWHGQRLLDRRGLRPAHPLGSGLSYTSFALARPQAEEGGPDGLTVSVLVTNTGDRAGSHVVQVYGAREDGTADDAVRALLGFARVDLEAGQSRRVRIAASLRPLARRDPAARAWTAPSGLYRVEAAAYCGDPQAAAVRLRLGGG
ncbi:glycoside hydrolase family 3 C-terminal domain-containing protein [Streptacidiphilus sp. ASG 303]|nr:glycoside hydrolase family 3 C-terminal domain-containing protein [Streptacidiphilus sp. ASG 303]